MSDPRLHDPHEAPAASDERHASRRARNERLVEGGAFYAAITGLRAVFAVGLTVALARALGRDGFGHWSLLVTWASALTVFSDLGTSLWVTREVARSRARAVAVVSAGHVRLMALTAIGVPATWLAMAIAGTTDTSAWTAAWCLALAGVLQGCLAAALRGTEALRALLVAEVLGITTHAIGIGAILVLSTPSSTSVLLVAALAQTVQALANWRQWRAVRLPGSSSDVVPDTQREATASAARAASTLPAHGWMVAGGWSAVAGGAANALKASWPFAGLGFLAQIQVRWTPLALGALGSLGEVGLFGCAARVTEGLRLLPQGALGALFPVWASESATTGVIGTDAAQARVRILRWSTIGALVVSAAVLTLAPAIVRLLFGPTFDDAVPPLRWLTLALTPGIANAVLRAQLLAAGHERAVATAAAGAVGLQMLTSLPLMGTLGATGAAISVLIGELATLWRLHAAAAPSSQTASALASSRTTTAGDPRTNQPPQLALESEPNRR